MKLWAWTKLARRGSRVGAEEVTEEASTAVSPGCRVEDETSGVSDKEVPALSEKMGGTQCRGTRRGSREKCRVRRAGHCGTPKVRTGATREIS